MPLMTLILCCNLFSGAANKEKLFLPGLILIGFTVRDKQICLGWVAINNQDDVTVQEKYLLFAGKIKLSLSRSGF